MWPVQCVLWLSCSNRTHLHMLSCSPPKKSRRVKSWNCKSLACRSSLLWICLGLCCLGNTNTTQFSNIFTSFIDWPTERHKARVDHRVCLWTSPSWNWERKGLFSGYWTVARLYRATSHHVHCVQAFRMSTLCRAVLQQSVLYSRGSIRIVLNPWFNLTLILTALSNEACLRYD